MLWRPHMIVKYTGRMPFYSYFCFFVLLDTCTAYTREPILTQGSLEDEN